VRHLAALRQQTGHAKDAAALKLLLRGRLRQDRAHFRKNEASLSACRGKSG